MGVAIIACLDAGDDCRREEFAASRSHPPCRDPGPRPRHCGGPSSARRGVHCPRSAAPDVSEPCCSCGGTPCGAGIVHRGVGPTLIVTPNLILSLHPRRCGGCCITSWRGIPALLRSSTTQTQWQRSSCPSIKHFARHAARCRVCNRTHLRRTQRTATCGRGIALCRMAEGPR